MIHLVRLSDDGGMEYLDGKQVTVYQHALALAFAPLPKNAAQPNWALYE